MIYPFPRVVVEIARSWIGTPYHHQASVKGVGCDCVGLVRGVWRELIGPEPEAAPPYSRDWGDANGVETLLAYFRRHLIEVPLEEMEAGHVVTLRWKPRLVAKHCMIISGPGLAIHAVNGAPVSEIHLSDWWTSRFAAAFAFPEHR